MSTSAVRHVTLDVLAIVPRDVGEFVRRVLLLSPSGDVVTAVSRLSDGIDFAAAQAPDLVLVDVDLEDGAGLAMVHHVRALVPHALVYAIAAPENLAAASQALALGGHGVLAQPLTGDEILAVLAQARERVAVARRMPASPQAEAAIIAGSWEHDLEALVESTSERRAADRIAWLVVEHGMANAAVVYLRAGHREGDFLRSGVAGDLTDAPITCDEDALTAFAEARRARLAPFDVGGRRVGCLIMCGAASEPVAPDLIRVLALTLTLVGERERAARGAMKDPKTSGYTFAYFVDVASREIERARRHGRTFSLAVLRLVGPDTLPDDASDGEVAEAVDRALGTVRASDVLSRVDRGELQLLLPETDALGAMACRRRLISKLRRPAGAGRSLSVAVGLATYPQDGTDLSRLLQTAGRRATEHAELSLSATLGALGTLDQVLDGLEWDVVTGGPAQPQTPQSLRIEVSDVGTLLKQAALEALRGGRAFLYVYSPESSPWTAEARAVSKRFPTLHLIHRDLFARHGDAEAVALVAEHAVWATLGRWSDEHFRGYHAAGTTLLDRIEACVADEIGGAR